MKFLVISLIVLISASAFSKNFEKCQPILDINEAAPFSFDDNGITTVRRDSKRLTSYDLKGNVATIHYTKDVGASTGIDPKTGFLKWNQAQETSYVRQNEDGLPASITAVSNDNTKQRNVTETQFAYDPSGNCYIN